MTQEYEPLHITSQTEHTRAFIKVQDGCNQFCSYCIIPYTRGRVRSRRPEDVEAEVRRLASEGYREAVLTGIHLSSYGMDFQDGTDLLSLIRRIHGIDGIETDPFRFSRATDHYGGIRFGPGGDGKDLPAFPSVPSKRLRRDLKADEPPLYL